MRSCPRCGAPLREGDGFCPNCGVPLGPNAPRRRRKAATIAVVAIIITCLIVVATVGVLVWRRAGTTPAEATKSAPVEGVDAGETAEAKALSTPVVEEAQPYVANYLWQAGPATDGVPGFRCVVDGIPEGAVLGVHLEDYDGDGELERLVARWQGGTVVLEVQESDGTPLTQTAVVGETGTWPLGNEGRLEVLAGNGGTIVAQGRRDLSA